MISSSVTPGLSEQSFGALIGFRSEKSGLPPAPAVAAATRLPASAMVSTRPIVATRRPNIRPPSFRPSGAVWTGAEP